MIIQCKKCKQNIRIKQYGGYTCQCGHKGEVKRHIMTADDRKLTAAFDLKI